MSAMPTTRYRECQVCLSPFCNLTALEHLIGEIADASNDDEDEDEREEPIPAISVKDPTR